MVKIKTILGDSILMLELLKTDETIEESSSRILYKKVRFLNMSLVRIVILITCLFSSSIVYAQPTLSHFSPPSGDIGTEVGIFGANLLNTTAVTFNGTPATIVGGNAQGTLVLALVPSGATTGPIAITTPGGTATSTTDFLVDQAVLSVPIDIRPFGKRNRIKPDARGQIWVAVLSDAETPFDALQIDIPTVRFGPDGAEVKRHRVKDVNRDGLPDLLMRFKIRNTEIACGDTEATLTGETFEGIQFTGTDAVKTVRCK